MRKERKHIERKQPQTADYCFDFRSTDSRLVNLPRLASSAGGMEERTAATAARASRQSFAYAIKTSASLCITLKTSFLV